MDLKSKGLVNLVIIMYTPTQTFTDTFHTCESNYILVQSYLRCMLNKRTNHHIPHINAPFFACFVTALMDINLEGIN